MATLTKGLIARLRGKNAKVHGVLHFQFNPPEIKRTGSVQWKWGMGPGALLPVATFGKMGEMLISLELLFDARESYNSFLGGLNGVLAEAESIGLPAVDRWSASRNALAVSPDRCRLVLGNRVWTCECTKWDINEEMWNKQLEPIRARVSYSLRLVNAGADQVQAYLDNLRNAREMYESVKAPPPATQSKAPGGVGS